MAHQLALLKALDPTGTIAAATVATTPPSTANMIDLGAYAEKAPPYLHVEVYGSAATERLLSGAVWWGVSRTTGLVCRIGPAFDGVDVTISNARSAGELLEGVAGRYSKIGITGTLAGDGLVIAAAAMESRP
jgi:hypothetical protein